ncbi:MAG TPA: hypothetical protein P5564_03405 [Paludibacteraceae bacterium]|mgnify:CR=1 FL=1|nr:hypothetical protein [Paludibacteraceae bacterium]
MALIAKSDLFYSDYSWTVIPGDNPKVTGEPDSTLLNRKEGYEIIDFINKLSEIFGFKQKASAIKIEKMIRNEVPDNLHSQRDIKEWIRKNWSSSKC